jgi:pyruvate dehydrogenase E1 component
VASGRQRFSIISDGLPTQLPDIDPDETREWVESFDDVVRTRGRSRARYVMLRLLERAREQQVGVPGLRSTDYINTIPPEREPWFPGDEYVERRIRAYIRWNAAVMVSRANRPGLGVGGHIATYASAASLYEVGFNHFFRGKDHGESGDQVYFQGHAAPGIYARAFLEGRLTEQQLNGFRQELSHPGGGLPSYPHPRLMPDFWEFPTVSMGLSAINAIYQARFNRYLLARQLKDTSRSHVWAFLGDGETDEPEVRGAIALAAREELDNLTFVINCNLQRLDGPVRGNGKIIQELEATFRGAGWNVIKVIWGRDWDPLLAKDTDGVLVNKMNTTPDGQFQTYAVESGAYTRENFFGGDPRLRAMVEHLSDDEIRNLSRGGHDYRKVYAAFKASTEHVGQPTVILAHTIKGWTLGPDFEAGNASAGWLAESRNVLGPALAGLNRAATFSYPGITMPAAMTAEAACNHVWISCPNTSAAESAWPGFMMRADGVTAGRLRRNVAGVLVTDVNTEQELYDSTAAWRDRAMAGQLHSGTLVQDRRSADRTSW